MRDGADTHILVTGRDRHPGVIPGQALLVGVGAGTVRELTIGLTAAEGLQIAGARSCLGWEADEARVASVENFAGVIDLASIPRFTVAYESFLVGKTCVPLANNPE
jgi:hypothetical protein